MIAKTWLGSERRVLDDGRVAGRVQMDGRASKGMVGDVEMLCQHLWEETWKPE